MTIATRILTVIVAAAICAPAALATIAQAAQIIV